MAHTATTANTRHERRGFPTETPADRLAPGEAPPAWVPLSAGAERVSLCERTLRRAISAGAARLQVRQGAARPPR